MVDISTAQTTGTPQKETIKVFLRVSPALHAALRRVAYESNTSINKFGCDVLAKATSALFEQDNSGKEQKR